VSETIEQTSTKYPIVVINSPVFCFPKR